MLRSINDLYRISYSRNTFACFVKLASISQPCRTTSHPRHYSHLFHCKYKTVRNPWNKIFLRNKTKRSRKDILAEYFYKNVYQGIALISFGTALVLKCIGLKLLMLQLAPILYMLRNQLGIIKKTFVRDIK